jgi:hypothetical protein
MYEIIPNLGNDTHWGQIYRHDIHWEDRGGWQAYLRNTDYTRDSYTELYSAVQK